jgi:hypothetical protein
LEVRNASAWPQLPQAVGISSRPPFTAVPSRWVGTTLQVPGLWPFGVGSTTPTVGVPMGRHLYTGDLVCFDPISWYTRTSLIATPSCFVLGEPGMGKSTAIRRMVLGLAARGTTPLILGDLKPDYAQLVKALGGQVIRVGPGQDRINPLDVGPWIDVIAKVDARTADQVRAGVIERRVNMVSALITLVRTTPPTADEITVLSMALRLLAVEETGQPVLSDVLKVIQSAPEELRQVTLAHGDDERYHRDTEPLQRSLIALLGGVLGDTFDGQTTTPIDLDTPAICIDISGIDASDQRRTAAMLLSTWSYGFAVLDAANLLADVGAAPKRTFFTVLDEMWRVLRAGAGLIDKVDSLTRLNRQMATGVAYAVHGLNDLLSMPDEADRAKAKGFADRSAVMLIAASTDAELDNVDRVRRLSGREREEILRWTAPESWSGEGALAAGRGNMLLKVGSRPGIPVHLTPTKLELQLGNTDFRWDMAQGRRRR